jgi:hypothetical protein
MTGVRQWIRRGCLEDATCHDGRVPGPVMSGDFHGTDAMTFVGLSGIPGCAGPGAVWPREVRTGLPIAARWTGDVREADRGYPPIGHGGGHPEGSRTVSTDPDGDPMVRFRLYAGLAHLAVLLSAAPSREVDEHEPIARGVGNGSLRIRRMGMLITLMILVWIRRLRGGVGFQPSSCLLAHSAGRCFRARAGRFLAARTPRALAVA